METFQSLGLAQPILQAITEAGYETPTPIQLQAVPSVMTGRDVLGIAQTGTGKTAAFALPILHRLAADRKPASRKSVRALILSPTRELASQIADSFRTYGKHLGFTVAVVFGGVSERPQADKLGRGVDILVATPGRLLDHMGQRNVSLAETEIFVLDEADQMLDLGFFKPIRRVVADLPKQRQSLFFSATMPKEIEELTRELLKDPVKVAVAPGSTTVERVSQRVIRIEQSKKKALLAELLAEPSMFRTLVFTRTKRGADRVAKHLNSAKISAAAIHGNKSQNQREAALHAFKTGNTAVLVATDIAARGIDIDDVTHVVNFELPEVPEAYVHRIGRTARAGASGSAVSFCDEGERHLLRDIERITRQTIDSEDRRNDEKLAADKPAGRGERPSGEPRDGERPSEARREFKRQSDRERSPGWSRPDRGDRPARTGDRPARSGDRPARTGDRPARTGDRPAAGGERQARPDRPDRGDRPPRRDGDRPQRRDGERTGGWQSRNREGGERRFEQRDGAPPRADRPSRDEPRREREGGDQVWTNDGSRPDREHRASREHRPAGKPGEHRFGDGGRPAFGNRDRGDRRPDRDREPRQGGDRREDRPQQARGERPPFNGERRGKPSDGPRRDREPGAGRSDRPFQSRGESRQGDRPRPAGERWKDPNWKPREPRSDDRGPRREGGDRPRSDRPQGERREGAAPRRDDDRRDSRPAAGRGPGRGPGGDRPRQNGSGGAGFGGQGGMKRGMGERRDGKPSGFRKPDGDRRPRRDADGA